MTTKTPVVGGTWTLIATSPTRVLLQARGSDIEVYLGAVAPSSNDSGFRVRLDDWADFIRLEDFGVNLYARATGREALVYHVDA